MYSALLNSSPDVNEAAAFAAMPASDHQDEETLPTRYWLEEYQCYSTMPPLTLSGIKPAQLEIWEAELQESRRTSLGTDVLEVHRRCLLLLLRVAGIVCSNKFEF